MTVLPTYVVRLYMAGDIETAKRWVRRECLREGLCVTLEPTTYIYSGGEEAGFVVGFLNYPRFPADPDEIWRRAWRIGHALLAECAQRSATLTDPIRTEWLTVSDEQRRGAVGA